MAHTHSSHADPELPTGGVQPDNINLRAVFGFGIGLAVVAVVVQIAMLWMWKVEVNSIDASNPPRVYPLAVLQDERQPPEPRLQTNPKQDLKDLRAAEDTILNGYSWVDRNNNVVRIPIDEAMKLTLQHGLPSRPAADASAAQGTPATPATQEHSK
jgi:hypothetical protein